MKKRTIGAVTLLIIFLGSFATLAVASPITTLGTIDYYNTQDTWMRWDLQGNASLNHIYSEMNESSLEIEKIWYDSYTNKTTYQFTTQKVYVEWWFIPDVKEFVYIDENSNNLYRVNVNYSDITIPENPYTKQYRELKENYTLLFNNYNLTNSTLANITLQFDEITELYDITMQQFNVTKRDYLNKSKDLTNLTEAYIELESSYNKTDALWNSAIDNVSYYQTSYDGLIVDYDQLEKDHDNLAGSMPWYIFISFFGTFLFTYVYLRRKNIFNAPSEMTDELTTSYGTIHSAIDKHILSRLRKEPETMEKGKIEELSTETEAPLEDIPKPKDAETKTIESSLQNDILTEVNKKIDANARATDTRLDARAKETDTKIEALFKGIDERIKKLAEGTKQ